VPRPFRFGVLTGGPTRGRSWLTSLTRWEELGYTSVLVIDHVANSAGLIASLSAAVCSTTHMIVGSLTAAMDFRHPVLLCKEMATLDMLWPGRVEMGVGAGWLAQDYSRLGLQLESAGRRIDRLGEGVIVIRRLLGGGGPVTFHGQHFDVRDASLGLSWTGSIPLVLGGGGRKMLDLAARHADIVSLNPQMLSTRPVWNSATLDATREKSRYVISAAGDRADHLELAIIVYHVFPRATANDIATASRSLGIDGDAVAESPHCLIGDAPTMAASLLALREDIGTSYIIVPESEADRLAPVIDLLKRT
jgi:probable F420-dependent oxidoreductase